MYVAKVDLYIAQVKQNKLASSRSQVWLFATSRDNNFQSFVSQMCTILRKDIWSYWTVLMAWLKLITWRHWQFHLALLNRITWRYWTVSPGVTEPHHLMLLDGFTCHYWTYWTVSPCVTETYHLTLQHSSCSICNDQLFNLRLIAINMTIFWMT